MSDLIKSFAFDLQRFAGNFKGGKVEGEEGITLSNLFNSQGTVWKVEDASKLGNRTYFWENEDAKVSLTPATDNASVGSAKGIKLIRGTYDDPVTLSTGKLSYGIKSVEAIDASGVTGTATFANLDGVTRIINPKGTLDVANDSLGAITFSGTGTKSSLTAIASVMGVATGTVVSLDGSGNIQKVTAAAGEEVTTADGTKATFKNGGTASFKDDSFNIINALANNGTAEVNVTNGTKVTLEVGNVVTSAEDGAIVATARLDGQTPKLVSLTAASADIGFGGSEVVGKDLAIQDKNVNVAGITTSSEILYKFGAKGGDILDLTSTTKTGTIAATKTGNAKFVVANDVNSVEGGTDLTIGGTAFAFTDAGANGGVFVTENSKVTGFVFRDVNDALTVKKGQTEPELYELPTSSAMNVKSKSGNESFAGIKKATLPFKVTSTGADYTITKTADGYSIEVGEGDTVIENTATGAKISMTIPPASANTASTAALNFNEAGQLDSITNGAASGGKENTGLSGNGASLNLSGFTGSDIAGNSLSIGDISIDIPEESSTETPISYDQKVETDDEGNTVTEITTNADIEAKDDDDPTAEANPYVFTRGEGVSDTVQPTYLKNDGGIYGIKIPANTSITGPFDGITELNEKAFDIDPKTAQTTYTFGNDNGTLNFAGLQDGDAIVSGSGIGNFITGAEGTFDVLGTTMAIAGDSEVAFTATDGVVTGLASLSGTATGDFVSNVLSVNGTPVEVVGDEDKSVAVTGNDTGITAVTELNGADVDVKQATGATQIGDTSDGKLTLTYAAGESFTISGNGSEQTYFDLDGNKVASISGLDQGETINGVLNGLSSINGESVALTNKNADGSDAVTSANVASDGKLVFNDLQDGASLSAANAVANVVPNAGGSGTYYLGGHSMSINGQSDLLTFITNDLGQIVGISGLDDDATFEGELGSDASIKGIDFDIKEIPTVIGGVSAGDGVFSIIGTTSGIERVEGLGGSVAVIDAGGASQLVTNANIQLTNGADGRTITIDEVIPDGVTFELDDDGAVTAINGLSALAGNASGNINGLAIDGAEIDVTGDGDNELSYSKAFGILTVLSDVNDGGNGVEINKAGDANVIVTEGDGTFTFFDDQTFTTAGEGRAFDDGADVTFSIEDSQVTAIDGVNGKITGNFGESVAVNGAGVIQVEGDDSVEVVGNKKATAVTAINDVDAGSTVVSAGGAATVVTNGEGVYTFSSNDTEDKYSIVGDDSVIFNLNTSGAVTGIDSLTSGTVISPLVTAATVTIDVNPSQNDPIALSAEIGSNISLSTDDEGKLIGVAGVSTVAGLEDATVAANAPVTVNGTAVNVQDADDSFNVVVSDRAVANVTDVTGDATINGYTGSIETDADGQFEINGASYSFSDEDGVIGMNVGTAGVTNISSLEGSVILDDGDATITVNGNNVAINTGSTLPVTITSDGEAITAVTGLVDGDTISGALDKASIAMVGGDSSTLTVNKVEYELYNDKDGVTVNGAGGVKGLDEEALLVVDKTGTYVVNGHTIQAQAGDAIIGYDNGKYAELYDPDTVLLRKNTPDIEKRLGTYQNYTETLTGVDGTTTVLAKDDSDSIFAAAAEGEYDLDKPYLVFADNYDYTKESPIKETQTLDFSGTAFTKKVSLKSGSQDLKFNSDGGNLAIVSDTAQGEKNITLGGGATANPYGVGDAVIVEEAKAIGNRVNITGGAGDDSVFVRANSDGTSADVTFDMGGSLGGADKLITYAGSNARVTLANYDPNSGAGIQIEEPHVRDSEGGIAHAIEKDGNILFGDGIISVTTAAGTAEITFDNNSVVGGTLVNLYTPDGTKQGVGFTHSEGGVVDGSATSDDLIIIGNNVGKKKGDSTLVGGIGNDTVFAGAGDSINAGEGNNAIVLEDSEKRGGAAIVLNAGNTVIKNTNNTFYADHGDTLEVAPSAISYDGSNLIINGEGFNATVEAPDKDSVTGAAYTNQLVKDAEGKTWKMAVGTSDAVIDVKADEDIRADYYKAGGVTFKNYNGAVQVDLSKGEDAWATTIDGVEAVFENVVSLEGGSGNTVFKGSEANETFVAGKGNTSLYGAGGKNLLVGYNDGTDDNFSKEGSTTFYVLGQNGTAVNTIQNFAFVNDNNYTNNSIAADMIEIDVANNFVTANSVEVSNSDVVFSVENRETGVRESVLVKDAAGKDMRVTDGVIAQVAKDELTFDKFANFYLATGKNATVKVSNDQDYSKVWLDNTATGSTFVGDIHVIDATNASVTAELAGNDYNNTIIAGTGDTSLWGGNFGDDVLVGNASGKDTFYYALGNGADTIQGAKEGDVIDLTGVTIADIEQGVALGISQIDETGVSIGFANGGTLRVDGTAANVNYVVQGETYTLNEDRTLFVKKS